MNNYFYDIKEKLAAIGGKRKLTESVKDAAQAVPGYVPDDIDEDQGFAPDEIQLDELSPKTLGSYVKKAAQDSREASYASAADYERGNIGRHERGLDHSDKRQRGIDRAVDKMTNERAGPVGGGKWQDKMHLEEESDDMEDLLSNLRKAYGNIEGIDPDSPTYTKLIDFLDNLDREHLQVLADAGVKFVSMLAKNRLRSGADKLNELSKDTLKSYKDKSRAREHEIMKNHEYGTQRGRRELGKRVKGQMDANRAVDRLTRESYDDFGPGLHDDDPWDRYGFESMDDVINAGLSMLNDGMPIRDILNMFHDEGLVESDKEVRELISALKNKGGSAMESKCCPKTNEGYRVIPSLDDEYEERAGLEGPFNANGRPIYYDPKEGKYWDPKTDFYLDDEEASTLFAESFEVVVEHKGKLKRIIVDLPKAGKRKQ